MNRFVKCTWSWHLLVAVALLAILAFAGPAYAQEVDCSAVDCKDLPTSICDAGGFKVTQTGFTAANGTTSGLATYTYEICSPPAGVCQGGTGLRAGESCLGNSFCQSKGRDTDPEATCARECAVDVFRGLSHFDIFFPELGGLGSCLSGENTVSGTCACTTDSSTGCSVDSAIVLGDGSCYGPTTPVAKCDNTELTSGDCIVMTLNIAGELTGLGNGVTTVVSKESGDCNESCLAGPSCESCNPSPGGGECLTRTIGFWGTHPWITNDYGPVTVCGKTLNCSGASDGKSDPRCLAGSCDSIMEGLGSIGGESPKDAAYIAMVKQLTAAKLNLNATAALFPEASCADFRYNGQTIQQWISYCEGLCSSNQATISGSGCIEALNAFNNSQDTGFTVTPSPFDRPPVDDFGNMSGADGSQFTAAHGNSNPPGKWVIGKKVGANDCR
jgi:hypothetical protein